MTDLCSDNADFSYVPFEVWGKQRVLRGDGKVKTVGKTIWTGLIASFPDLTNTSTPWTPTTTATWWSRATSAARSSSRGGSPNPAARGSASRTCSCSTWTATV